MHHDSHILNAHSGYCETCGQRLPEAGENYGAWDRKSKSNRVGIGISIALHLLGVLYYLFAPSPKPVMPTKAKGGQMVYIQPLEKTPTPTPKPQQKKQETAKASKPPPPRKQVVTRETPAAVKPKLETYVPPVQATMTPPPQEDMMERIARRRAEREAANPQPAQPAVESADDRANRIAKANIGRAQGAGNGADKDDTGGIFQVDKSFHSADVKFRGWNTNFKRRWLQQIHVEQGSERDIETAVAKEMVKIIRKEKPGDFEWDSRRLGKVVTLSARKEDEEQLIAFLLKEMFPEYTRGASR